LEAEPGAIVGDRNNQLAANTVCSYFDFSAIYPLGDPVPNRVFHQRLHQHVWQLGIVGFRVYVKPNRKAVGKTRLLDAEKPLQKLELLSNRALLHVPLSRLM